MAVINHLKGVDGQSLFMAVAYGLHMVSGVLTKSIVTGTDPTHVIKLQQMLGRGPWDGCEGLWWNGLEIVPAKYKFYPGIQSPGMGDATQGQDTVFDTDTPHSGFAWLRAELPTGVGDFDTKTNPPVGLAGRFRTMKVQDYDSSGATVGSPAYSTNPALQVADLIIRLGRRPTTRIDWGAWTAWRDFLAATISFDYSLLPIEGFGLSAKYFNGVDFDTQVIDRVDPYVEFVSGSGSPGIGVNTDNFSARFEGLIKPKYTETYTFYITHTHGARVWVNNLSTALIDEWTTTGTHSATIALTAGQYYDIKVEWKHTTGTADLKLEWQSTSQDREVVTHRALFPKTVSRPRYETHPFFAAPTRLDDAVREILNLCNSTYQEVNGKLRFFCLEQLSSTSFSFTNANIVDGSLRVVPRDILQLRNSWQASFRDVDSQYVEEPIDPIVIERDALIAAAGRRIDGQSINLYNTTVHQAYRTMEALVKRRCDGRFDYQLTGTADSYKVLPGDAVAVDVEFLNVTAKQMLVIEANDDSSEGTPDERQFTLEEWTGQTLKVPLAIAGVIIGYEASEISGLASGDPVPTWQDLTPSNLDATRALSDSWPQYIIGANGEPYVDLNGGTGGNYFTIGDLSALTEGECFILVRGAADPASAGDETGLWKFGTSSDADLFPWTNGVVYCGWGTDTRKTTSDPATDLEEWNVWNVWSAAGDFGMTLNGSAFFSTATNTVAFSSSPELGRSAETARRWGGDIAAFWMFDRKLSDVERTLVQTYMAGIKSLLDAP